MKGRVFSIWWKLSPKSPKSPKSSTELSIWNESLFFSWVEVLFWLNFANIGEWLVRNSNASTKESTNLRGWQLTVCTFQHHWQIIVSNFGIILFLEEDIPKGWLCPWSSQPLAVVCSSFEFIITITAFVFLQWASCCYNSQAGNFWFRGSPCQNNCGS